MRLCIHPRPTALARRRERRIFWFNSPLGGDFSIAPMHGHLIGQIARHNSRKWRRAGIIDQRFQAEASIGPGRGALDKMTG